eukprot:264590_1
MATFEMKQRIIQEEYKLWKKNSPFLYDLVLSSALEWPSLTVEWLPDKRVVCDPNDVNYSIQRMLIGTHTNDTERDYLMIAEVKLPTVDVSKLSEKYKQQSQCDVYGGFGGAAGKFDIVQKIPHNGEANRARYMPQNSNIIASKTKHGSINIFDRRKYPSKPDKGSRFKATMVLSGHEAEGYGLEWNKSKEGWLLSSADDGSICVYDIQQIGGSNRKEVRPQSVFKKHIGQANDIAWHRQGQVFGSVGEDKCIMLWDTRTHNKPHSIKKDAHKSEINCISFAPFNEHLFVSGGSDNHVALWDKRNIKQKLHQLEAHSDQIYQVAWSPHSEVHLASSSSDGRVMIWDLSQIGHEQNGDDAQDGPPELMFIHAGHTDKVADFSWNHNDPWVIASVADNNIVQCWQMTEELLAFEDTTQHVQLE